MIKRRFVAALLGLVFATAGLAAQGNSAAVTFSVASVKANRSGDRAARTEDGVPGAYTATNVWLTLLITYAYEISDKQLESAPDWTRTERFDIAARLEPSTDRQPAGPQAIRLAMRTLLAERFNLAVKRETREVQMYALVMARSDGRPGPLLKRSSTDCSPEGIKARTAADQAGRPASGMCGMRVNTGRIQFGGPLSEFAKRFSPDGRSVIDRTGLAGDWEFQLTFMPDQFDPPPGANSAIDPNAPALPTALQEQLGLKLEPTKGTIDVLVVERVERPTEN